MAGFAGPVARETDRNGADGFDAPPHLTFTHRDRPDAELVRGEHLRPELEAWTAGLDELAPERVERRLVAGD